MKTKEDLQVEKGNGSALDPKVEDLDPMEVITFFGREYEVVPLQSTQIKQGWIACADYVDARIQMLEGIDLSLWLETFLHEVTHLAQNKAGRDVCEEDANWVATFIFELLVKNRQVCELFALLHDYMEGKIDFEKAENELELKATAKKKRTKKDERKAAKGRK